ncbi:MAG: arylsulfatase [Candidatus Latescibacteria bacterium]|nr:arylsulfatase [Candidatus Latescibacterota bacterium]
MTTASQQPNILFICVDQWRADCLGMAGHPVVETPHLDRLGRDGVNFTQAYSATPTCVPARAGLLTGLSPRHHGFVGYNDRVDWHYDTTLPGTLAAGGYHTQCVGKMHTHPARNLMGFHNVVLHDGYLHRERSKRDDLGLVDDYTIWLRDKLGRQEADYLDTGIGCNGYAARPWVYDEMLHPTSWVTTQGIDFLRRRDPGKPFFLMLSYHRPHPPLDPPRDYLDRYLAKDLPPVEVGDWVDWDLKPGGFDSPIPTDAAQRDYARRAYYAQITHIDHQLNRMIMALFESGAGDNTAIIFTSDHGEMLYQHNLMAKGTPFDGSARVPLLFRPPNNSPWKGETTGRSIDRPVELRDILPTCCDLGGIDVPVQADGNSLVPLAREHQVDWRTDLHGEHVLGPESNQWLTDGREKYIWYSQSGRQLLFDLTQDPTEMNDLSGSRPDRVQHWRSRLQEELAGREEGFVQDGELVAGRPQSPTLSGAGRYMER